MGTNFFTLKKKHVGKRSAAGLYCWDCNIRLSFPDTQCPSCGKSTAESFIEGAAARELGFNKTKPQEKHGVASCSSFTWAMNETDLKNIRVIVNEYGDRFTKDEFYDILKECPIRLYHAIGKEFS
jgi:hypothetical protein